MQLVKSINCPLCTNVTLVATDVEMAALLQVRKDLPENLKSVCRMCFARLNDPDYVFPDNLQIGKK